MVSYSGPFVERSVAVVVVRKQASRWQYTYVTIYNSEPCRVVNTDIRPEILDTSLKCGQCVIVGSSDKKAIIFLTNCYWGAQLSMFNSYE